MLSVFQSFSQIPDMGVVGRGNVDDIHVGIGKDVVDLIVNFWDIISLREVLLCCYLFFP